MNISRFGTQLAIHLNKYTIRENWCGGISKVIEDLVYEQFDSKTLQKDIDHNKLNPFIIKLLEVCRLRMETQLAEKYDFITYIYIDILTH
jgi:hypothetical protein